MWLAELGIGYYPVSEQPYDAAYWERYRQLDDTSMGAALTQARVDLVKTYLGDAWSSALTITDIGIGGGRFVRQMDCQGHDINPVAVRWLRDNGRQWDGETPVYAMTFWDSLEHIHDLTPLLALTTWAFVAIPIYENADHVLRSKHFRKDEHCWYFTQAGFLHFMEAHGFTCLGVDSNTEVALGREDIVSYAFRRPA